VIDSAVFSGRGRNLIAALEIILYYAYIKHRDRNTGYWVVVARGRKALSAFLPFPIEIKIIFIIKQ
jgi:hypothetical protein